MIPNEPIRFDAFMLQALHDPERGYYARRIRGIGRGGDFTTAPKLGNLLARALADWIRKASRETGCRQIIEVGAGDGTLAEAILRGLPWWERIRFRYHLVESSPTLGRLQLDRLGTQVHHHTTMESALACCGHRAVIFSNELVDAFPVRRFERNPGGWSEIFVQRSDDGLIHEILRNADPLPDSSVFHQSYHPGQRVEVHESYRNWLEAWLPLWKSGRMLTIDYGSEITSLYHRRPQGTVRAYLLQQRLEGIDIYQHPGRQDLTADVNFTDLQQWHQGSLKSLRLVTLAEFAASHSRDTDPVDQTLLDPLGAGSAFLVLEQCPDFSAEDLPKHGRPV